MMITIRNARKSRCLVLGLLVGKTLLVCGCIGDELMMIRIRIDWESRCLVLGLLLGKNTDCMQLNWG
jgi:hypothetical protein